MTTTTTDSTVSAEQAMERVQAWLDLTRDDDPKNDIIVKSARGGSADMELRKSDLRALIAQHSTEPVAARWWLLEVGEVICEGDEVFNTETQEWEPLVQRDFGQTIGVDDNPIRRRFSAQGQSGAKVSRYPWNDAPWWAEFATTDSSGRSVWHQQMPTLFGSEWYSGGNMVQIEMNRLSGSAYKTSLEQRPTGETK